MGRPDDGRGVADGRGEADAGRPLLGGGTALTPSWVVSAVGWSGLSPARNHGEEERGLGEDRRSPSSRSVGPGPLLCPGGVGVFSPRGRASLA